MNPEPSSLSALQERVTLRAVPLRVGESTKKKQTCRFRSAVEPSDFSLEIASEAVARELGAHLHKEVEIEATVSRNETGDILRGSKMISFLPLEDRDPLEALQTWFRESCSGWDTVEDVNRELGRDE